MIVNLSDYTVEFSFVKLEFCFLQCFTQFIYCNIACLISINFLKHVTEMLDIFRICIHFDKNVQGNFLQSGYASKCSKFSKNIGVQFILFTPTFNHFEFCKPRVFEGVCWSDSFLRVKYKHLFYKVLSFF